MLLRANSNNFRGFSSTARFFAGRITARVYAPVFGDMDREDDETLGLYLTGVTPNAVIADPLAIGTILGDDGVVI